MAKQHAATGMRHSNRRDNLWGWFFTAPFGVVFLIFGAVAVFVGGGSWLRR